MKQDFNFKFATHHASWHRVSTPVLIFCRVWFLFDYNMPLGAKSQLPLNCIHIELSSLTTYHASWHRVLVPTITLYGVQFSCDSNMPLGMKYQLPFTL